jgi:nuclease S1
LAALKYIVHFVVDSHQPLHAGYHDDRGGNTYQLQAFMRGSNFHALWDSGLIRNLEEQTDAMSARLSQVSPTPRTVGVTVAAMAEESCRIVASPGFYLDRKVGMAYVKDFTFVLEEQLVIAGARLAAILNEAFQ